MKNIIKQTAKAHGVSEKDVRRELKELIKEGMTSNDPDAVLFWSQFEGKEPSPEMLISILASSTAERIR
ncbi:MAG: hypothetical protein II820_04020 [Ruminiclostridium sp.]|nr:hypothetical protein [Ruminiclostridium sp.]